MPTVWLCWRLAPRCKIRRPTLEGLDSRTGGQSDTCADALKQAPVKEEDVQVHQAAFTSPERSTPLAMRESPEITPEGHA